MADSKRFVCTETPVHAAVSYTNTRTILLGHDLECPLAVYTCYLSVTF